MISLWIATFCSASIALLFKLSATKKLSQSWVTMSNYFTASFFSAFMLLMEEQRLKPSTELTATVVIGVITGVFFLLSFVLYQISVRKNGASLSGMFAKLGILIPMVISVVVWSEIPTMMQMFGICMAMFAIAVANVSSKSSTKATHSIKWLIALFVGGGIAEFSNKIFQKTVSLDYRSLFLFLVFATALALSILMHYVDLKRQRKKGSYKEDVTVDDRIKMSVVVGVLVGIPNLFASYFLLNALNDFPASVVYPAYSAGSILIISILSVILFKEILYKKDWIAIILTALSLILLNL